MDFRTASRSRHTAIGDVRKTIPSETLTQIAEAGRQIPTSSGAKQCRVVIIDDDDTLRRLANMAKKADKTKKSKAAIALVTPTPSWGTQAYRTHYDLGQISDAMQLQAIALGIASRIVTVGNSHRQPLTTLLKLHRNEVCPYLLILGWAHRGNTSVARQPSRPPGQFVTWLHPTDS